MINYILTYAAFLIASISGKLVNFQVHSSDRKLEPLLIRNILLINHSFTPDSFISLLPIQAWRKVHTRHINLALTHFHVIFLQ